MERPREGVGDVGGRGLHLVLCRRGTKPDIGCVLGLAERRHPHWCQRIVRAMLQCPCCEVVVSTGVSFPAAPPPPPPFQPIAQVFDRGLSIRHVYGEPVRQGELTVIPVAKVAFGFGAGVGRGPRRRHRTAGMPQGRAPIGTGGGGGGRITPVGALVIGRRGARFVRFGQVPRLVAALSIGVGLGLVLARRAR